MRKINSIILHCTATPEGKDYTVEDITRWHKERGFRTIGYHYVIYRDGSVHKGRKNSEIGAHCTGKNANSIGVVYIGGMTSDNKKPKDTRTTEQHKSLLELVQKLMRMYNLTIQDVHCHNEFAKKSCPCFNIADFRQEFIKWLENG